MDRPGPHAVLATPDGWWSWGRLYDPWPCVIEEAWLVGWEEDPALRAEPLFIPPEGRAREHPVVDPSKGVRS